LEQFAAIFGKSLATTTVKLMTNHSFPSPLRYPGGKRKLANYVKLLFEINDLLDGDYAEPYAGGCSVALSLLFGEYASRIFINDIDPGIYSFWHSVLNETEELNRLIRDTSTNMDVWRRQRQLIVDPSTSTLIRGFASFYLNRTNRSGIIMGGVIGGQDQEGNWKMDARFNRNDLIKRINKIAHYKNRIQLTNLDALDFINVVVPTMSERSLTYFDPPYYVKGQGLYANFYGHDDHANVAATIGGMSKPWLVSYDNTPQVQQLYKSYDGITYDLAYSAQSRYQGKEAMFFSDGLERPNIENPSKLSSKDTNRHQTSLLL
jgi:DNA adenine methylase